MTTIGLDTSVAIPLLVQTHTAHDGVVRWWDGRDVALCSRLPGALAARGIAGGAVYDALVGLGASDNDSWLATRDGRARATYEAVGARVVDVA
ncbi:MAG: hypothetical protein ACRDY0_03975 [Acidimicrobiales bacterium]